MEHDIRIPTLINEAYSEICPPAAFILLFYFFKQNFIKTNTAIVTQLAAGYHVIRYHRYQVIFSVSLHVILDLITVFRNCQLFHFITNDTCYHH